MYNKMRTAITKMNTTEISNLKKNLIQVNAAVANVIASKNPKTYAEFKALREKYDENFTELENKKPIVYASDVFKMSTNRNFLDPKMDYRNLKHSSQFTDEVIKHNVDYSFSVDPRFITTDKNSKYFLEQKAKACEYLMNVRDLCVNGDIELLCLANTLPYENNSTDTTDEFNGIVFAIKNQMYDLASKEGKFISNLGALQMYDLQQKMLNKEIPANLYIDKNSCGIASKSTKGSYTNAQELAVASVIASKHPNLIFYVTLDRPKQDIINWLSAEGYAQLNDHKQYAPDLTVIDTVNKTYRFVDIKNCSIINIERYFPIENENSQILVFVGRLSQEDKKTILEDHKYYHVASINGYLTDPNVTADDKAEAIKMIFSIKSDKDSLDINPMNSKTSILVISDTDI